MSMYNRVHVLVELLLSAFVSKLNKLELNQEARRRLQLPKGAPTFFLSLQV